MVSVANADSRRRRFIVQTARSKAARRRTRGHVGDGWGACYGQRELTFNLATLGRAFFEEGPSEQVNALLLHELAHELESNHLDVKFYKALQTLGAKLATFALREPWLWKEHGWRGQGSSP